MAVEIVAERLDHHPLARGHDPQRGELVGEQRARVRVGEQAGLFDDHAGHRDEVVDGRRVAVRGEPLGRDRVPELGALAQCEQGLVAARGGTRARDRTHLVGCEEGRLKPRRRLRERAVAALVAAQHRQRDEHLG